jgi:hypothetical protein
MEIVHHGSANADVLGPAGEGGNNKHTNSNGAAQSCPIGARQLCTEATLLPRVQRHRDIGR